VVCRCFCHAVGVGRIQRYGLVTGGDDGFTLAWAWGSDERRRSFPFAAVGFHLSGCLSPPLLSAPFRDLRPSTKD
jgi:hypothetical protein